MSQPQPPPQAPALAKGAPSKPPKPQWFHRGGFLIGLAIVLVLGAIVFYLWYSLTHKDLLAKWSGPQS